MGSLFGGAPKPQPVVQAGPSPTEIRLEKEAQDRKDADEKRKKELLMQRGRNVYKRDFYKKFMEFNAIKVIYILWSRLLVSPMTALKKLL